MLGDPDPHVRDELAFSTLATWISRGSYDDLLPGLGDGMVSGLGVGLGTVNTDSVFRRSFSALVLAVCIERDSEVRVVPDRKILEWGDRLMGWLLDERDQRGFVPGRGWAHTMAHGADALGALSGSPAVGEAELSVVLDVIADLLTRPQAPWSAGETDRLALAAVQVLQRDLLSLRTVESWLERLSPAADPVRVEVGNPYLVAGNVQGFLRGLYLLLALGQPRFKLRPELVVSLLGTLRESNAHLIDSLAPGPE